MHKWRKPFGENTRLQHESFHGTKYFLKHRELKMKYIIANLDWLWPKHIFLNLFKIMISFKTEKIVLLDLLAKFPIYISLMFFLSVVILSNTFFGTRSSSIHLTTPYQVVFRYLPSICFLISSFLHFLIYSMLLLSSKTPFLLIRLFLTFCVNFWATHNH